MRKLKLICIITVCFMLAAAFTGCSILKRLGSNDGDSEALQPVSSIAMGEEEAQSISDKVPIHLYFANSDNTKLKLEVRHILVSEARKSVNHLAGIIVDELLKGPTDKNLKSIIPAGTKRLANVTIDGTVATVDLSKEFVDKHPGGETLEKLTIYSVVNSLTELVEINKVQFLVDGKKVSKFKEKFKFDVPFPRSTSVISMETTSAVGDDDAEDVAKKMTAGKGTASKTTASRAAATSAKTSARASTASPARDNTGAVAESGGSSAADDQAASDIPDEGSEQTYTEAMGDDVEAVYIETLEEAEYGEVLE